MAEDLGYRLRQYLLCAPQNIYGIGVISFTHSAMSQVWHVWREMDAGQVRLSTGEIVDVRPVNATVELAGTPANLDQAYQIAIDTTDDDDLFREELDRIPLDTQEFVRVGYTEFLSDDLLTPLASVELEATTVSFQIGAAAIQASSPRYNVARTGELYEARVIPMLRDFQ